MLDACHVFYEIIACNEWSIQLSHCFPTKKDSGNWCHTWPWLSRLLVLRSVSLSWSHQKMLSSRPLSRLAISASSIETLRGVGFNTVEDILELSEQQLSERTSHTSLFLTPTHLRVTTYRNIPFPWRMHLDSLCSSGRTLAGCSYPRRRPLAIGFLVA